MAKSKESNHKSLATSYNDLLIRYPLMINGLQAAIIAGLGVLASQLLNGNHFDFIEVYIMMFINFAYHTPILLAFNNILQKTGLRILPMLIIDQLLFSPLFTCGIVGLRLLLLGNSIYNIPNMIWSVVPGAMISSWMFWVPSKAIIFNFVPPMYQLLAGNAFSFIWTIIFAMILQKK